MRLYLLLLLLHLTINTNSQDHQADLIKELKTLEEKSDKGQLSKKDFIYNTTNLLGQYMFNKGLSLPGDTLIKLLNSYKAAIWAAGKEDESYRSTYFGFLATNADINNKVGEAMFYAEKYSVENSKLGQKDLLEQGIKLNHYTKNRNYPKVIETFEAEADYIRNIYKTINTPLFNENNCINAQSILYMVSFAYYEMNLIEKGNALYKMASQLDSAYQTQLNLPDYEKFLSHLKILSIQLNYHLYNNELSLLANNIKSGKAIVTAYKDSIAYEISAFRNDLFYAELQYLINTKQYSKAISFYDSISTATLTTSLDSVKLYERKWFLYSKINNHEKANEAIQLAINSYKNELRNISNEMDGILYAHAEAEYNKNELGESEKIKSQRLYWIIAISVFSLLTIGLLYSRYKLKIKKQDKILEELNNITAIQIQEAIQKTTKDQQLKIGQNLHDDLSSTLAGNLYLIERLKKKVPGIENELDTIYKQTHLVYSNIRNQSHQLFNSGTSINDDSLDENVKNIIDAALPGSTIKKEIEIDKEASSMLNLNARIEILKIIQEAMTNIVKHAPKANEAFVFLYKQEKEVVLQIGNNGQSVGKDNNKGIGLQSIQKRVKSLSGHLDIINDNGFVINIQLPC
ncbi:sensor histidine kinase [Polluticaenibacter yanchengensis]|uniref:histidine kinase n=1 Tax=Polluticaenibacter yanchengensis TaxID=3014562 RepID=A0ABT4UGK3_9BACT|nr:hypothetical protein [Chitinophagaceae bacterium LY-5]